MEEYQLDSEDDYVLSLCERIAREQLTKSSVTPDEIVTIGNLLKFIDDLPTPMQSVRFELSITFRQTSEGCSEMTCISFNLTDTVLEASRVGSVNYGQGSDSLSFPKWYKSINNKPLNQEEDFDINDFEDEVSSILNQAHEFRIYEESSNRI